MRPEGNEVPTDAVSQDDALGFLPFNTGQQTVHHERAPHAQIILIKTIADPLLLATVIELILCEILN